MTIAIEEFRLSDSWFIESISRGRTLSAGSVMRPAEANWHIVLSKHFKDTQLSLVGPWESAGTVSFDADTEVLWIRFRLGVYMPHLLTRKLLNSEISLPQASGTKFWLNSTAWQCPDYHNADVFINRLIHQNILTMDPFVQTTLNGQQPDISLRTLRHRFLQTTGASQNQIYQIQRAWEAEKLLRNGLSVLDVVEAVGYYDQPHLTRALKKLIGYTPAEIIGKPAPV